MGSQWKTDQPKKKHQKVSGNIYEHCLPLCLISPSSILLKSCVVQKIGFFDPSFLACEDYDYFLRLSLEYPIYCLNQKLIIKQGGHSDQLSHQYPIMDDFRIQALIKILKSKTLAQTNYHKTTLLTLIQKCEIVRNGCCRRGKYQKALEYTLIIQKYSENLS